MEKICRTCMFFHKRNDQEEGDVYDGDCRRYPPVYTGAIKEKVSVFKQEPFTHYHFPLVESDEWCGEWKLKEEGEENNA